MTSLTASVLSGRNTRGLMRLPSAVMRPGSQVSSCQMKIHTSDRLDVLVPCGRPDAALVRVSCTRMGHVENVTMCSNCARAVTYCQACFDTDKMLVRATILALSA